MKNFSVKNSVIKRVFNSNKHSKIVSSPLKPDCKTNIINLDTKDKTTIFQKIKNQISDFREFCADVRHGWRRNCVYVKCGDEWVRERDIPNCAKGFEEEYLIRKPFRKDKIIDAKTYYEDKW